MEQTIAIIGDEDSILGFRLAGVQTAVVAEADKIKEQLAMVKDATMLIVTEPVAEMIEKQNLKNTITGTMVQIPDKTGSKGLAKEKLAELFEAAIGVKLKN